MKDFKHLTVDEERIIGEVIADYIKNIDLSLPSDTHIGNICTKCIVDNEILMCVSSFMAGYLFATKMAIEITKNIKED